MFVVMLTPAIPDHIRGYITRFLTEVRPNSFVGSSSAAVVDRLWDRVTSTAPEECVVLITGPSGTEQGFAIRTSGLTAPTVVDLDGLALVARRPLAENLRSI